MIRACEALGMKPNPVLLEEDPPAPRDPDIGEIKFLTNVRTSMNVTGNGIDGHDRIVWNRKVPELTQKAKEHFEELLKLGYSAFKVKQNSKEVNEKITQFDPNAEEILMVAPHRGG